MATQSRFPKEVNQEFQQWQIRLTLAFLSVRIVTFSVPSERQAQGLPLNIKEATEIRGSGTVNWTTGTISVSGIGVSLSDAPDAAAQAMAYRAAQVVASRNLLELVEEIRVYSETM
jgi:hypothetical protein